jgi:hypothetical protein
MYRYLLPICFLVVLFDTQAQNLSLTVGTDIPYQFYVGTSLETKHLDAYYRTGILSTPYSDAILNVLGSFEIDQEYIDLLDASYQFGWMNGIGILGKIGKKKQWYGGAELRVDRLTASDTPADLIEIVTGESINRPVRPGRSESVAELGLTTYGIGVRLGRRIDLDEDAQHSIRIELSATKHIASQTSLTINDEEADRLNQALDELFWEDVFKPYGFLGGLGISYSYRF